MAMPEGEEGKRKVIGKVSERLRKEFEEHNHEFRAIEDTMNRLLDRKAELFKRNHTLWLLAKKELNIPEEQFRVPLGLNDHTGEVLVCDKELSYKERYEALLKMLEKNE
jgi:hypothetical protein